MDHASGIDDQIFANAFTVVRLFGKDESVCQNCQTPKQFFSTSCNTGQQLTSFGCFTNKLTLIHHNSKQDPKHTHCYLKR